MRSYRTISPLPVFQRTIGGVFSVALSLGSPPVAVSHHRTLFCPDFPPYPEVERPPDPVLGSIIDRIMIILLCNRGLAQKN